MIWFQNSKWCQTQNEAKSLEWVLENGKHIKHVQSSSGGSSRFEHAESGGKSPLVSVKHSEKGRLTSKCGYSPAWKTLWEK